MAYSQNLPGHILKAAQMAMLTGTSPQNTTDYKMFTEEMTLDQRNTRLVALGGLPVVTDDPKIRNSFIERLISIEPIDRYMSVLISNNLIKDDQTGTVLQKFKSVAPAFDVHKNNLAFTALNEGDTTTYGVSVTGENLFSNSHIYKDAKNQTAQDNLFATTLSLTNFTTNWAAAKLFKDDHGNYYNHNFDLLVIDPTNLQAAFDIAGNNENATTANRSRNPHAGQIRYIVSPLIGAGEWYCIASGAMAKPVIMGVLQQPQLMPEAPYFHPDAGEGGVWEFKYHARYSVVYGDPLVAFKGN